MQVSTPMGIGELLGYILNEYGEQAIVKLRTVRDARFQRLHMFRDSEINYADESAESLRQEKLYAEVKPVRARAQLSGDEHMGEYVFCKQHLYTHTTGWCTVPADQKIALKARNIRDAEAEARLHLDDRSTK